MPIIYSNDFSNSVYIVSSLILSLKHANYIWFITQHLLVPVTDCITWSNELFSLTNAHKSPVAHFQP